MLELLTIEARQFLREHFDTLLSIPIVRNNRLRSTMGRYVYERTNKPVRIELAGFLLDHGDHSVIIDVLKHECIHYALHVKEMPSRDGHPYFEAQLKKHGVSSTNEKLVGKFYVYRCSACFKESVTRKKHVIKYPSRYRTGCCQSPLQVIGEKVFNGV